MMQVTQGNSEVWMHREQFWFVFLRTCICKLITYPHGKHAWTVREGAFVFEELEVHFADVMLQVKCCREVGLAVIPGTNQHRLMGSMDPFVPPQSIRFLEHLLTHLACKCSYDTFLKWKTKSDLKKNWDRFQQFCTMTTTYLPGCLAICFRSFPQVCSSTWQLSWGQR